MHALHFQFQWLPITTDIEFQTLLYGLH
jgi:hypothetical protein